MSSRHVYIPVELIQYAISKGIQPEFKVFVAAKMVTPGCFGKKSDHYQNLCDYMGIDSRTADKHIKSLIKMGWVGYNYETHTYFFRSWERLRASELFTHRLSVRFNVKDIPTFRAFMAAAVITWQIEKFKYYCKKSESNPKLYKTKLKEQQKGRLKKSVVNKGGTTLPTASASSPASFVFPQYFGFSNKRIASLLNCNYTYACNLKHEAEKAGYIRTNPQRKDIELLTQPDYSIRAQYYKYSNLGDDARKLRFTSIRVQGESKILMFQQLHDEIVPLMETKRIHYFQQLKAKAKRANFDFSATIRSKSKVFEEVDALIQLSQGLSSSSSLFHEVDIKVDSCLTF